MTASDPFGLVGQVLDGQYRVDALVRDGRDSVVYRGHNLGLNEPVCVKALRVPTTEADSYVRKFREDARLYCRISQTNLNLVRGITSNTTTSRANGTIVPYLVLEWLEGSTLASELEARRAKGSLGRAFEEARALLAGASDGLAHAHRNGASHRDLHPGNIYLVQGLGTKKTKLLDFAGRKAPPAGGTAFVPAYGAPEQFQPNTAPSPQMDVYAFALVFTHVLIDRAPVEAASIADYAKAAADKTRRPTPRALGYSVSDEIEAVFSKALSVTPSERHRDLGDFWSELSRALGAERGRTAKAGGGSSALSVSTAAAQPVGRPSAPPPPMAPLVASGAIRASTPPAVAPPPEDSDLEMPTRVSNVPPMPLASVKDFEIESLPSGASLDSEEEMTVADDEPPPSSEMPTRVSTNVHFQLPQTPQGGTPIVDSGIATTRGGPPSPAVRTPQAPAAAPVPTAAAPVAPSNKFGRTMMGVGLPDIPRPQSAGVPTGNAVSSGHIPSTTPDPDFEPMSQDLATTVGQSPSAKMQLGPPIASLAHPASGPHHPASGPHGVPPSGSGRHQVPPGAAQTSALGSMGGPTGNPNMTMPLGSSGIHSPYAPAPGAPYPYQPSMPQGSMPAGSPYAMSPIPPQAQYSQQYPGQPVPAQSAFNPQGPSFSGDPRFPFPTGLEEAEPEKPKKALMIGVGVGAGLIVLGCIFMLYAKFSHPITTRAVATANASSSAAPTSTTSVTVSNDTSAAPPGTFNAPIPPDTAPAPSDTVAPPDPTATVAPTATIASVASTPTSPPGPGPGPGPGPTPIANTNNGTRPPTTSTAKATPTATPSNEPQPFSMTIANAKLREQAGGIAGCKKGGPTGASFASVVFSPDGSVSAVTVDAPYTTTPEGPCIQGVLRRARVPAFAGNQQLVRFHFRID